jgi:putative ABC transport system permease protein
MESFLNDVRFGLRVFKRAPALTLWVILALALGIGVTVAMFSALYALLLNPVRYSHPEQLALLWEKDEQGVRRGASAANFLDWRAQAKSFSDIAGWTPVSYVLNESGRVRQIPGAEVTANFFRTLGVSAVVGRTFLPTEDSLNGAKEAERVAVIGYALWQESFGGKIDALGSKIELNSVPYTVIGVAPADFHFYSKRQVWVPVALEPADRDYRYLITVARSKGSSQTSAAELRTINAALAQQYPSSNRGWTIEVQDLLDWLVNRTFRVRLFLLFGAVGMVLLITCLNVAGLLTTRTLARSREIAVRSALGAGTGRLLRQVLTESLVLSLIGGCAGLILAWGLIRNAPAFIPPYAIPTGVPIELNLSVLGFALAVTLAAGIAFGMAPALTARRLNLHDALKEGGRASTAGKSRQRTRQVMVALQVAVALMLLVSATLLSETLLNMTSVHPGIDIRNVMTFRMFLPAGKYTATQSLALHQQMAERLQSIPGVVSAAAGSNLPLFSLTMNVPFDVDDSPVRPEAEMPGVGYASVLPNYFATLKVPIRNGRVFELTDTGTSPPVVVVNEAFVERYFPAQNPVGKRIRLERPLFAQNHFQPAVRAEIVGVVGSVRMGRETPDPQPLVYAPHSQSLWSPVVWFAVRTSVDPATLSGAVRSEIARITPDEPVDQLGSLEQTFNSQFTEPRFEAAVMSGFAALALLLAVIGIYGVNSYAVAQRHHEIGLRMALGATPGTVMRQTIGEGMRLTGIGVVVGLGGAIAAATFLRSVLVGVSATDPFILVTAALFLAVASAVASYLPARRAMRVDPAIALRQE